MILGLMPALRVGYLTPPRRQMESLSLPVPSTVVTLISSTGQDEWAAAIADPKLAVGELKTVHLDIPDPQKVALPIQASSIVSASSAISESGTATILCEVHVHQSLSGEVQAVDFGECNEGAMWQRSLLRSIQQAARLMSTQEGPFPPVRTLFFNTTAVSTEVLARQLMEPAPRR